MTRKQTILLVLHTLLSFGLNLLIERLGLDPRWRYAVVALLVLNEVRGLVVVWHTVPYVF